MPQPEPSTLQTVIIGYSAHGQVAARALLDSGVVLYGYCDLKAVGNDVLGLRYLGSESDIEWSQFANTSYFVAIGDNVRRETVADCMVTFIPALATPVMQRGCYLAPGVSVPPLTLIAAGATIQVAVVLGRGAIVNTNATIDHHCEVGAFAHIAPGATLAGGVHVGRRALIGANATVLPGRRIGADAVIGAGAVVTKDVPPGEIWVGNPAHRLGSI